MVVGSENLVAMLNPIGESAQLVDSVVDVESSRTPSRSRLVNFQLGNDAQKAAAVGVSNNVSETIVISEDDDEPTGRDSSRNCFFFVLVMWEASDRQVGMVI
jgi:hypothetical protein